MLEPSKPSDVSMQVSGGTEEMTGVTTVQTQVPATTAALDVVVHTTITALDASLYIPQALRQRHAPSFGDADDNINIIEDGEHVGTDDFGLSSAEISMSAPISMNVAMELNAMQQIEVFLAPPPSSTETTEASERIGSAGTHGVGDNPPSLVVEQLQSNALTTSEAPSMPETATTSSTTTNDAFLPAELSVQAQESQEQESQDAAARSEDSHQLDGKAAAVAAASSSSPSLLADVAVVGGDNGDAAYPVRQDGKVLQIRSHPIVQSVTTDGSLVVCKCGKHVRLNPPWYILKFEQHIVSRNCTFLRKKMTKRVQAATGDVKHPVSSSLQTSTPLQAVPTTLQLEKDHGAAPPPLDVAVVDATSAPVHAQVIASGGCGGASTMTVEAALASSERDNGGGATEDEGPYTLMSADELLKMFTTLKKQKGPGKTARHDDDGNANVAHIVQTLELLKTHRHFHRLTPDGRFLECKCSALLILTTPWQLNEFRRHVAAKTEPPKANRKKKANHHSSGGGFHGRVARDGVAYRMAQRMVTRETRWQPVENQRELPCPGLRGERVSLFIQNTTRTTGGSRARRRIAEELFPQHFPPLPESDNEPSTTKNKKKTSRLRLSRDEKMVLHDAVEGEALWLIDRDADAIRSLDCRGSMAVHKGETCCASCGALRSSVNLRVSLAVLKEAPVLHHSEGEGGCLPTTGLAPLPPPILPQPPVTVSSTCQFVLLEQEFDMTESYARLLRGLFRVDVEERSVKNLWFDAAELGISGSFTAHPTFLGVLESMMMLKDKERRGVGMQNMLYNDQLDAFMKSLSEISSVACDFFQQHFGGRKQRYLAMKKRKTADLAGSSNTTDSSTTHGSATAAPSVDAIGHLLDFADGNGSDLHDVDLPSFHQEQEEEEPPSTTGTTTGELATAAVEMTTTATTATAHAPRYGALDGNETSDAFLTDDNMEDGHHGRDTLAEEHHRQTTGTSMGTAAGYIPCPGLRDDKVQAYVTNAAQLIGGSRPKYVIAKELFPEVFSGSQKIKIQQKLSKQQQLIVLDAIFSECLWRVDKMGHCVRSLQCFGRVAVDPKKRKCENGNYGIYGIYGICRACVELKSIANFRSVLCRAKVPRKMENMKYTPSVYTESDPFMRKLSKNASLRSLYQTVKRVLQEEKEKDKEATKKIKKQVTFWLRFATMGLFGHFQSHFVFAGLVASMVEIKDRERRGVGKQNMMYAKPLDDFMGQLASLSMDAFELFTHHFCGRTMRSQKVKKRKATAQLHGASLNETGGAGPQVNDALVAGGSEQPHSDLLGSDDATTARLPITTAELEESQRFMDRMLDEVRLSTAHEMQIHLPQVENQDKPHHEDQEMREDDDHEHHHHNVDDPATYLDENGVLTTVL